MARYTGPKHKLARREGVNILEKSSPGLERRLNIPPGQHGPKGRKKLSEFGLQLREKQKLKRMYGILERQLRRYFREATKKKGETGKTLLRILEARLDNTLFRLNLVPSRPAARQLVTHGQVRINEQKVNIPSYHLKRGDVIGLTSPAMEIPAIKKLLGEKQVNLPSWLERKGPVGKVKNLPQEKDLPKEINEELIVEYYSR